MVLFRGHSRCFLKSGDFVGTQTETKIRVWLRLARLFIGFIISVQSVAMEIKSLFHSPFTFWLDSVAIGRLTER
jgi:uncharacterized membrane protein